MVLDAVFISGATLVVCKFNRTWYDTFI